MLTIYGSPRTSAGRCFLVLEEIGLPYDVHTLDMMEKREHKSPEYLALNPNGKVPCLRDGEFVLWESTAINYYLAEKYKIDLLGQTPEEKALVQQWTMWSQLELQPPLIDLLIQLMFVPEANRDQAIITKSREAIPTKLKILDQALADKTHLIGAAVTLADLNMASVVNTAANLKLELSAYPQLSAWFERMKARPAFQKLMKLRQPS